MSHQDEQFMDDCEQEQQIMNEQCHNLSETDDLRELYRLGEITFSDYMLKTSESENVKHLREKHAFKLK